MFDINASGTVKKFFDDFKNILNISPEESYNILKHIEIGPHHTFEDWEEKIQDTLKFHFIQHRYVYVFLKELVTQQSARLNACHKFTKKNLLETLAKEGIYKAPALEESEIYSTSA